MATHFFHFSFSLERKVNSFSFWKRVNIKSSFHFLLEVHVVAEKLYVPNCASYHLFGFVISNPLVEKHFIFILPHIICLFRRLTCKQMIESRVNLLLLNSKHHV